MIKIKKFPHVPKGDRRGKRWNHLGEAKAMCDLIKENDVVYDCGANIFDHAIFFALNNPKSKIVAFEPVKEYFDMGVENIAHFNVKNIQAINAAVGEKPGEITISVDNQSSSLVHNNKDLKLEKIKLESIDHLVEIGLIPAPNLIKIDVEGFGSEVIRGAINTIKTLKPTIILEVHPQFVGEDAAFQKIEFLRKLGAKVVKQLKTGCEFVLVFDDNSEEISITRENIDFGKTYLEYLVSEIRNKYDISTSVHERRSLETEYKKIVKGRRISPKWWLIWSKIYVFFFKRSSK